MQVRSPSLRVWLMNVSLPGWAASSAEVRGCLCSSDYKGFVGSVGILMRGERIPSGEVLSLVMDQVCVTSGEILVTGLVMRQMWVTSSEGVVVAFSLPFSAWPLGRKPKEFRAAPRILFYRSIFIRLRNPRLHVKP